VLTLDVVVISGEIAGARSVTVEQFVAAYGYPALLAGTFVEGETIVIAAGFAAHQGYMKLWLVMLAAFAGSLAGDQVYFFIGRLKGKPFLEKRPVWRAKAMRVSRLVDRHSTWIMLLFRFMYGFRTVTPLVIGASRISVYRFLALNAAGALIWVVAFSCIGFLFGAAAENIFREARKIEGWLALAILGAGALVWAIYFLRRKRKLENGQDADTQAP